MEKQKKSTDNSNSFGYDDEIPDEKGDNSSETSGFGDESLAIIATEDRFSIMPLAKT